MFSHLILFGFIYPGHRLKVPGWLMEELMRRLHLEMTSVPPDERLCQGTLLSWSQYLMHVEHGDYRDARLPPYGALSMSETAHITEILSQQGDGRTHEKASH